MSIFLSESLSFKDIPYPQFNQKLLYETTPHEPNIEKQKSKPKNTKQGILGRLSEQKKKKKKEKHRDNEVRTIEKSKNIDTFYDEAFIAEFFS